MISVVCYFWDESDHFSEQRGFAVNQVNDLAAQVKEHLDRLYRFICVTDETIGFSSDVELIALPVDAQTIAKIPTAMGKARFPSCYRRLWTFSEDAKILGDTVLLLDIDCFVVGDLGPLFDFLPEAGFVGWNPRQPWGETKVGGGTWRHKPGTRTHVWNELSLSKTSKIKSLGFNGSDQAILSFDLKDEPVFPREWILNRQDMRLLGGKVPEAAKIVHCNGPRHMKGFSNIEDVPWLR